RTRPDGLDPAGTAGRWLRGLDGEAVSLVQRGTTHGVLQSTKAPPTVRPELAAPIKALIEEEPSFGYRTVAGLLDINKNTVQRLWRTDLSRNRLVIAVERTSKEKPPTLRLGVLDKNPGDDLLSHADAHYHRRVCVSLPSSEWDRVVPQSYCHQGDRGG